MDEYISRNKMLFELGTSFFPQSMEYTEALGIAKSLIQSAPAEDVEVVRHGSWVVTENGCVIHCSECGMRLELCYPDGTEIRSLPRCYNCGAKMDGTE